MGITDLKTLVDRGEPVSQQQIDQHHDELRLEEMRVSEIRPAIELKFAQRQAEIEAEYNETVAMAAEDRDAAFKANLEDREKKFDEAGMDPSGNMPRREAPELTS